MARERTYYERGHRERFRERRAELIASTDGMEDCGRASHGRYVSGCRCAACRAANVAYERERSMRRVREECGAPTMWVDAAPVRRRLLELYSRGYTRKEIERLCGVGHTQQYQIVHRHWPVARVLRKTKDAVFSIRTQRRLTSGQRVDASWMAGHVREYRDAGMSVAEMSRRTGIDRQVLDRLLHGKSNRVRARTLHAFVSAKPELDRMAGLAPVNEMTEELG